MNEVKEALRNVEQKYKLFLQQQFTFIGALQHTREAAHDTIRPVASISQVQTLQHEVLCWGEEGLRRCCCTLESSSGMSEGRCTIKNLSCNI